MAVVDDVSDEYFHREIAWKKLKGGTRVKSRSIEFIREARIMANLEHPGVVPVHALIEQEDGLPAMTMHKVRGVSLSDKIKQVQKNKESWPLIERLNIFSKIAEILAYAHERKIVHRDIKPSNIMLGENGEVFLLDWGLAKQLETIEKKDSNNETTLLSGEGEVSLAGAIKGTPYYMSPEAARGKTNLVDQSSDIFSLGAVLYDLLTYEHLIKGEKAIDVLKNASESNYHSTQKRAIESFGTFKGESLEPEVIHILEKCIDPVKASRYLDADLLKQDMYNYLNNLPIHGYNQILPGYVIYKWFKRNWLNCVVIVLPLIITFLFFTYLDEEKKQLKKDLRLIEENLKKVNLSLEKNEHIKEKKEKELEGLKSKQNSLNKELNNFDTGVVISDQMNEPLMELIRNEQEVYDLNNVVKEKDFEKLELKNRISQRDELYHQQAGQKINVLDEQKKKLQKIQIQDLSIQLLKVDYFIQTGMYTKAKNLLYSLPKNLRNSDVFKLLINKLNLDYKRTQEKVNYQNHQHSQVFPGNLKQEVIEQLPESDWKHIFNFEDLLIIYSEDGNVLYYNLITGLKSLKSSTQGPWNKLFESEGYLVEVKNKKIEIRKVGSHKIVKTIIQNHTIEQITLRNKKLYVQTNKGTFEYNILKLHLNSYLKKNQLKLSEGNPLSSIVPTSETEGLLHDISSGYKPIRYHPIINEWMIVFSGFGKTRFKTVNDITGNVAEKWVTDFNSLKAIYHQKYWYVLGSNSEFYVLYYGFPAKLVMSGVKSFYHHEDSSLAFIITELDECYMMIPNTGVIITKLGKSLEEITKMQFQDGKWLVELNGSDIYELKL